MRTSARVIDSGFRVLNRIHRMLVRVSRGRIGSRAYGLDMVELTTIGRRSGRPHATMLLVPLIIGTDLVLVASKGGDDRDPDWLKNLIVTPTVQVRMRGRATKMFARVATPEEYAMWWPRVVARYSHYQGYQRRAHRPIPLVICTTLDDD